MDDMSMNNGRFTLIVLRPVLALRKAILIEDSVTGGLAVRCERRGRRCRSFVQMLGKTCMRDDKLSAVKNEVARPRQ